MYLLHRLPQGMDHTDEGPHSELLHWGRCRWLLLCRGQGQGVLCRRTRQLLRQGGSRDGVRTGASGVLATHAVHVQTSVVKLVWLLLAGPG